MPSEVKRQDIIAAARSFIGTPFHHQGRVRGVGVDCSGLVAGVCDLLGYPYQDRQGYSRAPKRDFLAQALDLSFGHEKPGYDKEDIGDLKFTPGDILLFWYNKEHIPQHMGIVTPRGLIHTYADLGRVVEHSIDDFWLDRLCKVYWFYGVEKNWNPTETVTSGFRQKVQQGVGRMKPCKNCGS